MGSLTSDAPDKVRQRSVRPWLGWVLSALVAVAWVVVAFSARPINALDFGRPMLVLPMLPVMLISVVYWLVQGLWRLSTRRGARWVPWTHIAIMFGAVLASASHRGLSNPVRAEDEPAYLAFAAAARDVLWSPEIGGSLSLDEPFTGADEPAWVVEARRKLEPMLPAYWPRKWLHVHLDEDTVVLYRGGGFGHIGIRIFKAPSAHSPYDEQVPSPPRRISDHVWFFTD
jgi:hypothetical protein